MTPSAALDLVRQAQEWLDMANQDLAMIDRFREIAQRRRDNALLRLEFLQESIGLLDAEYGISETLQT